MITLLSLARVIDCSSLLIFSSCLLRHTLPEMLSNVILSECGEQNDVSRHFQSKSQQVIVTNPQQKESSPNLAMLSSAWSLIFQLL
jgi:hypothetical protein